jgi:hypothetical protein
VVWLLMAVGVSVAQSPQLPEGILVDEGRSDYRIIISNDLSPSIRYAADELRDHLQQITGVRLPVVADSEPAERHEILVGPSNRLALLGVKIDRPALGKEGYILRTVGSRLVIVGGEPRGTLYGVYGLLEDHWGCRWFTPEVQRIPRRPRLALPQLDEHKSPVFEYREEYLWESFDGNWMARNRLNGAGGRGRLAEKQGIYPTAPPLEARHGGDIRFGFGFFVHSMARLVPPGQHFGSHPEYYALWKGKRDSAQLCCTNENAIRLCTQSLLAAMRRQPEATVFSVSQNDNQKYCECERCRRLAGEQGTQMAPLLHLVNRVAEAAEREFPDKIVETLAYQWSRQPPRSMRPRRNVVVRLCGIECCFSHPLAQGCCATNRAFVADLQAWARVCDRLWVWDYATDFAHYLLPFPNKRVLNDNLRLCAATHVTSVFELGTYDTPDGEFEALGAYLMAKFLWNPQYDEDLAINEFLEAYYGRGARPIRQYLDLLHDYVERNNIHVKIYVPPTHAHLTPELLAAADRLWTEAEACVAKDPTLLDRVRRSRMSVDYAIVEQGRAVAKTPAQKRTAVQNRQRELARTRFAPFTATLATSKLTRIREWKDVDKTAYAQTLATDLGISSPGKSRD